ncbi:hypothetical protein MMC11_001376 [Xylographa trunciseda]|nr:hypothetical protein [Xylographa trunciseda]
MIGHKLMHSSDCLFLTPICGQSLETVIPDDTSCDFSILGQVSRWNESLEILHNKEDVRFEYILESLDEDEFDCGPAGVRTVAQGSIQLDEQDDVEGRIEVLDKIPTAADGSVPAIRRDTTFRQMGTPQSLFPKGEGNNLSIRRHHSDYGAQSPEEYSQVYTTEASEAMEERDHRFGNWDERSREGIDSSGEEVDKPSVRHPEAEGWLPDYLATVVEIRFGRNLRELKRPRIRCRLADPSAKLVE